MAYGDDDRVYWVGPLDTLFPGGGGLNKELYQKDLIWCWISISPETFCLLDLQLGWKAT